MPQDVNVEKESTPSNSMIVVIVINVKSYIFVYIGLTYNEAPILANQNCWELGAFHRKLAGSHSTFYHCFDIYWRKQSNNIYMFSLLILLFPFDITSKLQL